MFDMHALLIGGLLVFYFTLICEVTKRASEEKFLETISWRQQTIHLGDYIMVKTNTKSYEGFYRGMIIKDDEWIFYLSSEGRPRIELPWSNIAKINKI